MADDAFLIIKDFDQGRRHPDVHDGLHRRVRFGEREKRLMTSGA
jgi:hypothetical protein